MMVADRRVLIISKRCAALLPGLANLLSAPLMNPMGDWLRGKLDTKQQQA